MKNRILVVILLLGLNFDAMSTDCNGVINGASLIDACGVCQQSYIYDYVTHNVTFIDDTMSITLGVTEMLVIADNPSNPYWNSSCTDCNGVINGTSLMDTCGVCQQSYIYDYVTHAVTFIDDTMSITLGATEMLVIADNPSNPYWNSSCTDCNGVINGTSLMDTCGVCQQSYIYDYVTHAVTFIDDTMSITLGATEILVIANDISNPYWNDCDSTTTNISHLVASKELVKVVDFLGREVSPQENVLLFYIYNDGTIKRRYIFR